MGGLRVAALHYKLDLRKELSYEATLSREVSLDGFKGLLTPQECAFTATEPFDSVEAARAKLEPQLEAWRQWVVLQSGDDWLPFTFHDYEAVPWPPPRPGSGVLMVKHATMRGTGTVTATLSATNSRFADPPPTFRVDPVVEIGMVVLRDAIETRRHTLSSAYKFFTMLEQEYGDRSNMGAKLRIARDTLKEFGELVSVGGHGIEARKLKQKSKEKRLALTPSRRKWVLDVLRELIRRQGQLAAGAIPADEFKSPRP